MMQPKDNSDNSWMVIADWMEDNDFVGANELRESINNLIVSIWEYEYKFSGSVGGSVGSVGSGGGSGSVGGSVGSVGSGGGSGSVGGSVGN